MMYPQQAYVVWRILVFTLCGARVVAPATIASDK